MTAAVAQKQAEQLRASWTSSGKEEELRKLEKKHQEIEEKKLRGPITLTEEEKKGEDQEQREKDKQNDFINFLHGIGVLLNNLVQGKPC